MAFLEIASDKFLKTIPLTNVSTCVENPLMATLADEAILMLVCYTQGDSGGEVDWFERVFRDFAVRSVKLDLDGVSYVIAYDDETNTVDTSCLEGMPGLNYHAVSADGREVDYSMDSAKYVVEVVKRASGRCVFSLYPILPKDKYIDIASDIEACIRNEIEEGKELAFATCDGGRVSSNISTLAYVCVGDRLWKVKGKSNVTRFSKYVNDVVVEWFIRIANALRAEYTNTLAYKTVAHSVGMQVMHSFVVPMNYAERIADIHVNTQDASDCMSATSFF